MNVVEVKQLSRTYKSHKGIIKRKKVEVLALKGIDFTIKKGEIFGLLGPNGAGKTTTIKILTTLLLPSGGNAKVLGFDVSGNETEIRKRINFVYGGERSLYWRLSARDNLRYFSDLHKIPKKISDKKIEELLKIVGLSERADEKVETYSKGMKQRLQIARGLVNNPEVLFLDEPTIGLDPVAAQELRNLILKLKQEGTTILLTTHYMQEADDLCDRIAFINKGLIFKIGTPEEVKSSINHQTILTVNLNNISEDQKERLISIYKEMVITHKEGITTLKLRTEHVFPIINQLRDVLTEDQFLSLNTRQVSLEDAYIHILQGEENA